MSYDKTNPDTITTVAELADYIAHLALEGESYSPDPDDEETLTFDANLQSQHACLESLIRRARHITNIKPKPEDIQA